MSYASLQTVEKRPLTIKEIDSKNLEEIRESILVVWEKLKESDTSTGLEKFEESLRKLILLSHRFCLTRHRVNQVKDLEPIVDEDI